MSRKLAYERYNWFHCQIKSANHPNARGLAERFELSIKQAQRDIEFMRDRLSAPLVYSPVKRGYEYGKAGYELPPVWFREDDLMALCIAVRLATTIPDRKMKSSLQDLIEKFLLFRSPDHPVKLKDFQDKISVKNIQYYSVNEAVFNQAVWAVLRGEPLKISYRTPHKGETTERVVQPLHLLCYMGSWHLIAFCSMRKTLRDFVLSRIRNIETAAMRPDIPASLPPIKEYVRENFGLMGGAKSIKVCLKFHPRISDWVSEQMWHPGQEVSRGRDGSVTLSFPVADFREVSREILKYGSDVEVLSPKGLRDEIRMEIKKMNGIYR